MSDIDVSATMRTRPEAQGELSEAGSTSVANAARWVRILAAIVSVAILSVVALGTASAFESRAEGWFGTGLLVGAVCGSLIAALFYKWIDMIALFVVFAARRLESI